AAPDRISSHAPGYATSWPPNSALKKPSPCQGCLESESGGGTPHRSKSRQPASAAALIAAHHARSLPISSECAPLRPAKRLYARPLWRATRTAASASWVVGCRATYVRHHG